MNEIVERIERSNFVVVLTGAGVSAESGIPTFRGKEGIWKNYSPTYLATEEAFRKNPKLVWEFYEWRRSIIRKSKPNTAHYVIKEIEERKKNFILITQNVDNLHQEAGSKKIIELHGNIFRNKCFNCSKKYENIPPTPIPPTCSCGGLLRPDVVWFGEAIPYIREAIYYTSTCDFMLVVGTSGVVEPAASLPKIAKENGAYVVEVNLETTPISYIADESIKGKAGEVLRSIFKWEDQL
jgi:NAD-dependent deacetylase